jgi:membrane protease subunit HflK
MRRSQAPSELGRLVSPLGRLFDAAWRRMHWWVAAMALLYGVSGITVIRPDEVAIVQRWGRLVGDTPALQERDPGILFALPRPMDRVVRVKTKHVGQLSIETLAEPAQWFGRRDTLDPLVVGYALTGDQNIVHVSMLAHYRVRDPADWAFYGPRSEDILRVEVTAAMVRSLGEMGVDHVLADGRKDLIAAATRRAQAGLDAAHAGLALVSLELTGLSPPRALSEDFDAVQSAYIETETQRKDAQAFAQDVIPKGHADADASVQAARAYAAVSLARARGDAEGFLALVQQYRASPSVVRERLYRDMVEKTIGGAQAVRWVPPAARGAHERMRVLVNPEEVATPQEPGGGPSEERP